MDVDEIAVNFPSMFELMDDLRAMGESNAIAARFVRTVVSFLGALEFEFFFDDAVFSF